MSRELFQRFLGLLGSQFTGIVTSTCVTGTKLYLNTSAAVCIHSASSAEILHALHASLKLGFRTSFTLRISPKVVVPCHVTAMFEVEPFSLPWTYCSQQTDHMYSCAPQMMWMFLNTATTNIMSSFKTCVDALRVQTAVPIFYLKFCGKSTQHKCLASRFWLFASNLSASFVPALLHVAAYLSCHWPKYKVWCFSRCTSKCTTDVPLSTMSQP